MCYNSFFQDNNALDSCKLFQKKRKNQIQPIGFFCIFALANIINSLKTLKP